MGAEELDQFPDGPQAKAALAWLKRENSQAYAAYASVIRRAPRRGISVQRYSPVRGTLAHAAWTAIAVSDGRAMDDDALMAMLPPDCDRQAWRQCFEDCRAMQTHPDSLKGRVACGGSEQAPG